MQNFKQQLRKVRCFVFDIDGVMTAGELLLNDNVEPVRTMNVKDGYAIEHALEEDYIVAVISGKGTKGVDKRLKSLGIKERHLWIDDKKKALEKLMKNNKLKPEEVLYMGDDIPDLKAMEVAGVKTCPADAATEIKQICTYISDKNGGFGCVRDVIEQVMRLHGKW
jgi:3-deoxy-D-manno-octulosonate 8-phosphate phosphatase (KDO 8-P phosphatase)